MTGLADNYSVSGSGGAVINHGLYTDTVWAVPVTFKDTAGQAINLAGAQYVLRMIDKSGGVAFIFRSNGNAANEGKIDTTSANIGQLGFTATEAQHAGVKAGLYRLQLETNDPDSVWIAIGNMLVGNPGAAQTYMVFDTVSSGNAVSASGTVTVRLITSSAVFDGGSAYSDFTTGPSLDLGSAN